MALKSKETFTFQCVHLKKTKNWNCNTGIFPVYQDNATEHHVAREKCGCSLWNSKFAWNYQDFPLIFTLIYLNFESSLFFMDLPSSSSWVFIKNISFSNSRNFPRNSLVLKISMGPSSLQYKLSATKYWIKEGTHNIY